MDSDSHHPRSLSPRKSLNHRASTADGSPTPRRRQPSDMSWLRHSPFRVSLNLPYQVVKNQLHSGASIANVRKSLSRLDDTKATLRHSLQVLHKENRVLRTEISELDKEYSRLLNLQPPKDPPETSFSTSSEQFLGKLKSEFRVLNAELQRLKGELQRLVTVGIVVNQAIIDHKSWIQPSFQAPLNRLNPQKRPSYELFTLFWTAILPFFGEKSPKKELMKLLKGKNRDEVEYWINYLDIGLTHSEISLLVSDFIQNNVINTEKFVKRLTVFQPFPLYEDIFPYLNTIKLHFGGKNYSKERLMNELNANFEFKSSKTMAKKVISNSPFGLNMEISAIFVDFLYKNKKRLTKKVDFWYVENWETIKNVIKYLKREFAGKNIPFEEIENQFPREFNEENVRKYAENELNLTKNQTDLLLNAIFVEKKSVKMLFPKKYLTISEVEMQKCFKKIAENLPSFQILHEIGLKTSKISSNFLNFSEFFSLFESEFSLKFTKAEKFALKVFGQSKTGLLNALDFQSLMQEVCAVAVDDLGTETVPVRVEETLD